MKKDAQFSSFGGASGVTGKTLSDLYQAIQRDTTLTQMDRQQLIQQVRGATGGASANTPLSILIARGLGGIIGFLLSKYFGLSPVGQLAGSALGFGLGRMVFDRFNKPKPQFPGWRIL